ncbi:hypothetical protein K435DRAFT_869992 [Dendrothele bispora CBS 962.96]|uniref:Uncharacterized protein n=1 Tax=Dendrothele bispora (strain CBS 962.96) TaxID=1314807 RepID=A0A4S8L7R9_DENBC|nr:hypothetical protein K435DRAFT_869992 [Dendrothele bispora CBS 962.96]
MSPKRNSTPDADPTRKRPRHLCSNTAESPCTVSVAKNPLEHPRDERSGDILPHSYSSHAKDVDTVEASTILKKNDAPENCLVGLDSAKIAPKTTIEQWIGRVKGAAYPSEGISTKRASDVAVQTDVTTFPVDNSSVPYEKLSNRFAKVKSKCNELYVSLDHAKLASEAGWTKYWCAEAKCRELRKALSESNKELTEARKAIAETTKELDEVREKLDDMIYVKEQAVSDARYWQGKLADSDPEVADIYDDYT